MSIKATCRECNKRKLAELTFGCSRKGGGSYKRPARWYQSTICIDCAKQLLASDSATYAIQHHLGAVDHWSLHGLRRGLLSRK